jgi:hypothetical protein
MNPMIELLWFFFPVWCARRRMRSVIRQRATVLFIAERKKAGDPPALLDAYREILR